MMHPIRAVEGSKGIRAGFMDAFIDRTGNVSNATGAADRGRATNKAVVRAAAAARRLRFPEEVDVDGLNVDKRPTM